MIIFWRLLLAHLLADFTLQFNIVNRLKRTHVRGMIFHCLTHFAVSAALTFRFLDNAWFGLGAVKFTGWEVLGLMLACHFIIDELRLYSMKRLGFRDGTLSIAIDQFLHLYVIFMISPAVPLAGGFFLAEKWVVLASIFVMVTHAATMFVFFVEKDLFGRGFPGFDEKYFMILERGILWAVFFIAGWWWLPFSALWLAQLFYIRWKRIMDITRTNIFLNLALTVLLGLWARYVYYGSL